VRLPASIQNSIFWVEWFVFQFSTVVCSTQNTIRAESHRPRKKSHRPRGRTAKADKQPTEAYQKLINELNILIAANVVYTLPRKPKDKPVDPA
jgi:hypothetical protein